MTNSNSSLDRAITILETRITDTDPTSEDYPKLVSSLEKMERIRNERAASADKLEKAEVEKTRSFRSRIDPNTVISSATSIAGILSVLHYERIAVVASKAFGLITKVRL